MGHNLAAIRPQFGRNRAARTQTARGRPATQRNNDAPRDRGKSARSTASRSRNIASISGETT
jgi:hypothetical protein